MARVESDQFMPEYWPANKLIGELEGIKVKAEDIIGELTSEQIKNLAAAKIIGQLTDEQIAEISAAKIAGQLTNEQIESLEAAKVIGQFVTEQIGNEAVTGPKIAAATITAEKIVAETITAALLAANSVTSSKILAEAITALKIAVGAITAEKLAVGSVVASKINVETLSAITANLGTVTAGILEAVVIKTPTLELKEETLAEKSINTIKWLEGVEVRALITAWREVAANNRHIFRLESAGKKSERAGIELTSPDVTEAGSPSVSASAAGISLLLIGKGQISSFAQLTTPGNKKIAAGSVAVKWPGGTPASNETAGINHGLGVAPTAVVITPAQGFHSCIVSALAYSPTQFKVRAWETTGSPAAGAEVLFSWIAYG